MKKSFPRGLRQVIAWTCRSVDVFVSSKFWKDVYYIHSRMYVKYIFMTMLIIVKK